MIVHPKKRTAGAYASQKVPTLAANVSAGTALEHLKNNCEGFDSLLYVYVVEGKCLRGVLSLHELLRAKESSLLSEIMITQVITIDAGASVPELIQLSIERELKAVPVVTHGTFLGAVSADVIMHILNEEHTNYLYRNAGIDRKRIQLYNLTLGGEIRTRIPWLLIGVLGGVGGAMIIKYFERSIADQLFVAAFIPAVVYIADAVGNQAEMLVVRALSQDRQFSLPRYFIREWSVAFFVSVILSIAMFTLSFLWLQNSALSLVLALSIVATVLFSVAFTVTLPWVLKRAGFDPAIASGPIATVVCDVSSVTIYLLIAATLLS